MNFIDAAVISFIIMWDTDYIKNASDIAENIIDYPKNM